MNNDQAAINEPTTVEKRFPTLDEFNELVSEVLDEFPEDFFKDLSGGVIVDEGLMRADYAVQDDIFTLGQYCVSASGRQIKLFYGSFARMMPHRYGEALKSEIRAVVRHEFRHHWEFLSGMHGADSLEAEDARVKQRYLDSHKRK